MRNTSAVIRINKQVDGGRFFSSVVSVQGINLFRNLGPSNSDGKAWERDLRITCAGKALFAVRSTVHSNPSRKQSFLESCFKAEEFENAVWCKFQRGYFSAI